MTYGAMKKQSPEGAEEAGTWPWAEGMADFLLWEDKQGGGVCTDTFTDSRALVSIHGDLGVFSMR